MLVTIGVTNKLYHQTGERSTFCSYLISFRYLTLDLTWNLRRMQWHSIVSRTRIKQSIYHLQWISSIDRSLYKYNNITEMNHSTVRGHMFFFLIFIFSLNLPHIPKGSWWRTCSGTGTDTGTVCRTGLIHFWESIN